VFVLWVAVDYAFLFLGPVLLLLSVGWGVCGLFLQLVCI